MRSREGLSKREKRDREDGEERERDSVEEEHNRGWTNENRDTNDRRGAAEQNDHLTAQLGYRKKKIIIYSIHFHYHVCVSERV